MGEERCGRGQRRAARDPVSQSSSWFELGITRSFIHLIPGGRAWGCTDLKLGQSERLPMGILEKTLVIHCVGGYVLKQIIKILLLASSNRTFGLTNYPIQTKYYRRSSYYLSIWNSAGTVHACIARGRIHNKKVLSRRVTFLTLTIMSTAGDDNQDPVSSLFRIYKCR